MKPSATLALAALSKELVAQGNDVISLSVGEPDWDTYAPIKSAAIEAIQKGQTKYTPANGIPELRKLIAAQTNQQLGTQYDLNQVTVTTGAKFIVFAAMQMILDPGDEVLIPAPFWVSYPTMVELADATPVIVNCGEHERFKLMPDQLRAALTPKTKMLILNSPSNPTGEVYSNEELSALASVLRDFPKVIILSDDIYNRLVFDGMKIAPHLLQAAPEFAARTVVINGASKTYAMTGWRLGWALGPKEIIQAMTDYQSQSVSCAASFVQAATVTALEKCQQDVLDSLSVLENKRNIFMNQLHEIKELQVSTPGGAFYLWVRIQDLLGRSLAGQKLTSSRDFCQALLKDQMVAVVPGIEFGCEGYLRMSYVLSEKRIAEAVARIRNFVAKLN
jgi:aspartate aminotransferase